MNARTMQAFIVIFPENFPVAVDGFYQTMPGDQILHRPIVESLNPNVHKRGKIGSFIGEAHTDETSPGSDVGGEQTVFGFFKAGGICNMWRAYQAT